MKKIKLFIATLLLFSISANSQTTINKNPLPSQTGHAGQYLKTNGTQPSWATVTAGLSGSLTAGYVPYAVSSASLANSVINQVSGNVYVNGNTSNISLSIGSNTSTSSNLNLNGDNPAINLTYKGVIKQSFIVSTYGSSYNDIYSNHTIRLFNAPPYYNSSYRILSGTNECIYIDNNTANIGIGTTSPSAKLHVVGLIEYADNATAITAGLTVGAFYRTGDLLKVVH